jgi:NADH-quinone oxidoreductase subunit J
MDLGDARNWFFLVVSLIMVAGALMVVTSRNVVHSALMLVATLAGAAAMFILLGAEFVAGVLVLVYIGAVVVLFLFGVMITRTPLGNQARLDHERRWPAALVALATFAVLAGSAVAFFEDAEIVSDRTVVTADIGESLFNRFVIPFEAVSFVLLAALIGGIVLARRDPES